MGHRQQMTDKQRLEWDLRQYNGRKQANRGHNFTYLTDELNKDLDSKGYTQYFFDNKERQTYSEGIAKTAVEKLRTEGCYARIVCISNKLRIKYYSVFFKKKK